MDPVACDPSGFLSTSAIFCVYCIWCQPWHVRTVFGDCTSRAKVLPAQAPRQYALISDFLNLAHLMMQEEATSATTWIKDGPEGLKLQKLALATRKPIYRQSTGNSICRRPLQNQQMRIFGLRNTIGFHGNPSARDFSPHMTGLRRYFFAECALPVLYVASAHPLSRF